VLLGAQELDGLALLLQRVFRRGSALHNDLRCLQLKRLLRFGRQNERTGHTQRSADVLRGEETDDAVSGLCILLLYIAAVQTASRLMTDFLFQRPMR
jgi:hypothetical protein